jgi:hypothetical protein
MGCFGFSYVGFVFLAMLTIPNLIWVRHKPKEYNNQNENKILLAFEKIGQVCVTCTALVFSNFNFQKWSLWSLWLIAAILLMILYECWWLRYFRSPKSLSDFYSSFCGIPVAGATLPVTAFLFLGVYGRVIWLIISVVILGIGHIGIHLEHLKEIRASYGM